FRQELRFQVPRGHGLLLRGQPAAAAGRAAPLAGLGAARRDHPGRPQPRLRIALPAAPRPRPRTSARRPPSLPGRVGGVVDPALFGDAATSPAFGGPPTPDRTAPRAGDARRRPVA